VGIFDSGLGDVRSSTLIVTLDNLYGTGPGGSDLTQRPWFSLVDRALDAWADVSGVRFVYEPNDDGAAFPGTAGVLGVRPDVRIGGRLLDGRGGTLGYNFYPDVGDMVLDTGDDLFLNNRTGDSVGLRNLVAHEVGHGLGLAHSCPVEGTKLMEPTISVDFDGPQHDDILGINEGYGDRFEFSAGNDMLALATDLGSLADGDTLDLRNLSIRTSADRDYLAFTVPDRMRVTIAVAPVGFVYFNAEEAGASCPLGFFVNTQNRNDLGVSLLGRTGNVLAGANAKPEGLPEDIPQTLLDEGTGTYFVYVYGDTNKVQLYDLRIVASAGQAPVALCKDVGSCRSDVNPGRFDNGSYDADGDALTLSVAPLGPYPPGPTPVEVVVTDGILSDTCAATVTVNRPPSAAARAVSVSVAACPASVPPDSVDDGSLDPDGDALTLSLDPPGPYGQGATPVTLIATDPCGNSDSAAAVVNVTCLVPVTLLAFEAVREGTAAVVTWAVAEAWDHAGFHVYREGPDGERVRISDALLRGETRYRFVDAAAPPGPVRYWLSELGRGGETTWYGPVSVTESFTPAFFLSRARPNPFARATTWQLAVPGGDRVELAVYDTRGRRVKTVIDAVLGGGEHEATWNGDTDGGGRAPAGLYFVRLRAGTKVRLQKAVLIP
jgi:hypothetical protein